MFIVLTKIYIYVHKNKEAGQKLNHFHPARMLFQRFTSSESDVESHVDVHVGIAHRDKLRCNLEELMVRSDEEVESPGMEVDDPTHGGSIS